MEFTVITMEIVSIDSKGWSIDSITIATLTMTGGTVDNYTLLTTVPVPVYVNFQKQTMLLEDGREVFFKSKDDWKKAMGLIKKQYEAHQELLRLKKAE